MYAVTWRNATRMSLQDEREKIQAHLETVDLDVRRTLSRRAETGITPRFMDQKCTPDVITLSAGTILSLSPEDQQSFTAKMIENSPIFDREVQVEFSKPQVKEESAGNEYNKVSGQPLKMLAFSGLLSETKQGRSLRYRVERRDLLEYIATNQRNSRIFLVEYLTAMLKASGIYYRFEAYFDSPNSEDDYMKLRDSFISFMLTNTRIKTDTEVTRIFSKVLNPLCHNLQIPGARGGHVSKGPILTSELCYNRENFRDKGKLKGKTRRQAGMENLRKESETDTSMMQAMSSIRARHHGESELRDDWAAGLATQVHHIFPKSQQPLLKAIPENLILLTATQHNTKAHPRNRTGAVSFEYQVDCLQAKLNSIEESISADDGFYRLRRFIDVANVGYADIAIPVDSSVQDVRLALTAYQNGLRAGD